MKGSSLRESIKQGSASLFSVLTGLLSVACPACFPAMGGLLASVGLGFLAPISANIWLISGFLTLAVLSFWYTFTQHRRLWIPLVGSSGALALLLGRFVFVNSYLALLAIVTLITAGIANLIAKTKSVDSCDSCT